MKTRLLMFVYYVLQCELLCVPTSGSGFFQWVWIASGPGYENPMGQTPCCIMWSTHNHGIPGLSMVLGNARCYCGSMWLLLLTLLLIIRNNTTNNISLLMFLAVYCCGYISIFNSGVYMYLLICFQWSWIIIVVFTLYSRINFFIL